MTSIARRAGSKRVLLISGGAGNPVILAGTVDPSAGGGIAAPEGSLFNRFAPTNGQIYLKTGPANTAWTLMGPAVLYGGISGENQGTIISLPSLSVYVQYDQFETDNPSRGTTPDFSTNDITIPTAGDYLVTFACSFSQQNAVINSYEWAAFRNGVTRLFNVQGEHSFEATSTELATVSGIGIAALSASDTIDLRVRCVTNATQGVRGRDVCLSVLKLS